MNQTPPQHPSHFWSGTLIGAGLGAGVLFLFGTSVGRHFLKNILEVTENLENNLEEILGDLDNLSTQAENDSTPKSKLGKVAKYLGEIEESLTR